MITLNASLLKVAGLAIIALALTIFLACGSASGAGDNDALIDDGTDATDDHDVDTADERVIHVDAENVKFNPDTITVEVGETIRITLENHDPILHDYTTDEADFVVLDSSGDATHDMDDDDDMDMDDDDDHDSDAQVSLQPLHIAAAGNEHAELVFQATEAGEYVFYCSVPGHLEAGMVGTIIVEE